MNALVQPAVAVLLVEIGVQVRFHAGRADLQHPRRGIEALLQLGHARYVLHQDMRVSDHMCIAAALTHGLEAAFRTAAWG